MAKERFNYTETFCDAVDIIVSEKLKQLSYDITKVCTIVDNTYKKLGRYTVQEETIKYEAYSTDTDLSINQAVLVVIPNGDYNMQKMILSKVTLDDDLTTSVAYSPPLKSMLNFTNNIVSNSSEHSLLANDLKITEKLIESIKWDNSYSGYTRMGISIDFQTRLNELNVKSGSYGLILYFYNESATQEDINNKNSAYSFTFNTNDVLGNPYHFESYTNQQKLIDISFLKDINQLDIYFYQNQDFKDYNGELISSFVKDNELNDEFIDNEIDIIKDQKLNDNLFINNLSIYLGYDLNAFSGDELILSTNSTESYSVVNDSDEKKLSLKWVHKIDNNNYTLLEPNDENIELYWVRYWKDDDDENISSIVGKGWSRDPNNLIIDENNNFSSVLDIDEDINQDLNIKIKVVGRFKQSNENYLKYDSNILTFTSSDRRVDATTYDAAQSLSIECEDGTEGNYFKYNQNSELINEGEGQGFLRVLHLYYKGIPLEELTSSNAPEVYNNIKKIQWTIPINSDKDNSFTMLNWNININDEKENYKILTFDNDKLLMSELNGYLLQYSILNTWFATNSHNKISCKLISKDGIIYETSKELIFGKANSQGSNLSLILQYKDNKNAYELKTTDDNKIIDYPEIYIQGLIYDLSGNLISADSNSTWTWKIEGDKEFDIIDTETKDSIIIQLKNNITEIKAGKHYNIIVVEYKIGEGNPIKAYLPIAIKTISNKENEIRSSIMEGARKIIYNSAGIPSYYTSPYILRDLNNKIISNINWALYDNGANYTILAKTANNEYALQANSLYVENAGESYKTTVVASKNEIIYWIQPILIMQSDYEFAISNNWNGKTTLTDDLSVISSVIAAGKRNEQNEFSGIVLGKLEQKNSSGTESMLETGLYGILDNIPTFSLTDKGQATFSTKTSRVLLGGGLSGIQSGANNADDTINSMNFNIDEGNLSFKANVESAGGLELSTGNPYLHLTDNNGTILLFNVENNYLQSSNFESGVSGLRINLNSKKIAGNNDAELLWRGPILINSNNFINIESNSSNKIFSVGKLKVDNKGEVYYNNTTLTEYIKSLIPKDEPQT